MSLFLFRHKTQDRRHKIWDWGQTPPRLRTGFMPKMDGMLAKILSSMHLYCRGELNSTASSMNYF